MPSLKVICMQDPVWESRSGFHKYHDPNALGAVVSYCLQEQKIPSELVSGFGVNISQAAYEMERLSEAYGKTEGIHLRHMVLSFSPSEIEQLQPDALGEIYKIGTYAAQYYGSEYQIVYSLHEDSGNYHVHFVMNTVSFLTGRKYRGDKADYYRFQDYLKEFLGEYYGMKLYVLSDKESHTRKIPAKPIA